MNSKIASSSSESVQPKSRQSNACRICRKLLDLYSRQRRKAGVDYVQAQTIWSKMMLVERDPIVLRSNLKEFAVRNLRNFMAMCSTGGKPPGGTSRVIEKEVELRLREAQP
jgi:hypothetical protein